MGKLTVVGRQSAVVLRRAVGLALIVGLLVSAVMFYRAAPTFPRSATATTSGSPQPTTPAQTTAASASPSPNGSPRSTHTTDPTQIKLPKGPGTTQPGILLMASPLRDGSFDVAELVLLATPTSSIWLGPPQLTLAGRRFTKAKPLVDGVSKSLPVALMVSGSTVLNIECPALPLRERACSAGRAPQLRVKRNLPRRSALIVVQFDLPRPQRDMARLDAP